MEKNQRNNSKSPLLSKNDSTTMPCKDLPDAIVGEILSLLTVKSLLRFRSACKSWNALIGDRCFITEHAKRARKNNNCRRLFIYEAYIEPYKVKFSIRSSTNIHEEHNCIEDLSWKESFHLLIESSNGIICLKTMVLCEDIDIILYNPMINESRYIPRYHKCQHGTCYITVGFGFAEDTGEGKVVKTTKCKDCPFGNRFTVGVYRLVTDTWCSVNEKIIPSYFDSIELNAVTLHGSAHWRCRNWIVSFDFSTEVFHEIQLWNFSHNQYISKILFVLNKCLAVCARKYNMSPSFRNEVWVMKEYGITDSWTKLYVLPERIRHPLGFTSNGEVVFEECYERNNLHGGQPDFCVEFPGFDISTLLISYDPASKMFETLETDIQANEIFVGNLTETLMPVHHM